MSSNFDQAAKRSFLEKLLWKHDSVAIQVNTQVAGVEIPAALRGSSNVAFEISRHFNGRLLTESDKLMQELLIQGEYFLCKFPYPSIWAVQSGATQKIWPECIPSEILTKMQESAETVAKQEGSATTSINTEPSQSKVGAVRLFQVTGQIESAVKSEQIAESESQESAEEPAEKERQLKSSWDKAPQPRLIRVK